MSELPAWIGFGTRADVAYNCPMMRSPPTAPAPPLVRRAKRRSSLGMHRGRRPSSTRPAVPCATDWLLPGSPNALEEISIPWVALGPLNRELLSIQAMMPRCGGLMGVGTGGSAAAMTVTVYAIVPEDSSHAGCAPANTIDETIALGPGPIPGAPPPLVSTSTAILHGTTGPVRVVGPLQLARDPISLAA